MIHQQKHVFVVAPFNLNSQTDSIEIDTSLQPFYVEVSVDIWDDVTEEVLDSDYAFVQSVAGEMAKAKADVYYGPSSWHCLEMVELEGSGDANCIHKSNK